MGKRRCTSIISSNAESTCSTLLSCHGCFLLSFLAFVVRHRGGEAPQRGLDELYVSRDQLYGADQEVSTTHDNSENEQSSDSQLSASANRVQLMCEDVYRIECCILTWLRHQALRQLGISSAKCGLIPRSPTTQYLTHQSTNPNPLQYIPEAISVPAI